MNQSGSGVSISDIPSNLYWAQLGLENSEDVKEQVTSRVERYLDFLYGAIKSLKEHEYRFSGKVNSLLKLAGLGDNVSHIVEGIYSDQQYRNFLNYIRGRERDEIIVPGIFKGDFIYEKDGHKRFRIAERRFLVADLKPVEVPEEEENNALDALFDSREVNVAGNGKDKHVRILRSHPNRNEIEIDELEEVVQTDISIVVKYNTYNLQKQGEALDSLIMYPQQHQIPLLNLLRHSGTFQWESFDRTSIMDYAVLTRSDFPGTEEQRRFVEIALSTKDFAILEGPPGSGKTSTLMEIILKLCKSGKKVLMVASTHVAVDNVLERIAESSEENGSLMDRFGVIPLRIGDIERVSENVKRFTVQWRVQEERTRLRQRLVEIKTPTEAQKELLGALMSEGGSSVIESLVMESTNFLCGTTIGILRSNIIERSHASGRRPFDYMILDEASKTTFADFIIPAPYAERWIISGDVKQLAPYIEQDFIQAILSKLPSFEGTSKKRTEEIKQISLDVFNAAKENSYRGLRGAVVISDGENVLENQYRKQIYAIGRKLQLGSNGPRRPFTEVPLFSIQDAKESTTRLKLLGSKIIFASSDDLQKFWKFVPPLLALRGNYPEELGRRERAFSEGRDSGGDGSAWEYEVAWRLNRAFELRESMERSKAYLDEIEFLLPYFLDRSNGRKGHGLPEEVMGDVIKVRNMFYPSVIELIQKGIKDTQFWDSDWEAQLYEGIPHNDFERRHILLTHQHRMHPGISKWARELFYDSKALIDSPELMDEREWSYDRYKRKAVWKEVVLRRDPVQNSRSNFNPSEVRVIEEELSAFLGWAKENPRRKNQPWKIALLTFYRGQEKRLQTMMKHLANQSHTRYFDIPEMNAEVEVCTVDRFQGQEADLVFLSMVRNKGVGFLDNKNRMNVAITRAKYQMVIVGNKEPFKRSKIDFLIEMAQGMEGPIL